SELALELITRGHRLIADDAPEFSRISPDALNGVCPSALSGFLEVRGLGILNIRSMFGDSAIKQNRNLRLIVHLQHMGDEELRKIDRLQGSRQSVTILEVEVPRIILPVAPGRNLAVLVEGAVRDHILHLKGYSAAQDFIDHQQRLISKGM
ncbi:MAG TPA: HPr(Ser) kinase/phosphatase, partial [Gammaproteobacteria bacterium]